MLLVERLRLKKVALVEKQRILAGKDTRSRRFTDVIPHGVTHDRGHRQDQPQQPYVQTECRVRRKEPGRHEQGVTWQKKANQKEDELRTAWEAICPPIYRDTDLARINARCAQVALEWDASGVVGIGILGTTGAGKTRALYHAMQRAHRLGRSCAAISHNAFSRAVGVAFSGEGADRAEARHRLEQLRRAQVVLIDDLGKAPSTERTDAELEDLVEERTANRRPILWTSNGSAGWLAKRLGNDRGEPFVRRLSEFSTIVSL
jgi:DNA replication protein DnaC